MRVGTCSEVSERVLLSAFGVHARNDIDQKHVQPIFLHECEVPLAMQNQDFCVRKACLQGYELSHAEQIEPASAEDFKKRQVLQWRACCDALALWKDFDWGL